MKFSVAERFIGTDHEVQSGLALDSKLVRLGLLGHDLPQIAELSVFLEFLFSD